MIGHDDHAISGGEGLGRERKGGEIDVLMLELADVRM